MGGGLDWSTADEIVAGNGVMQGLKGLLRINAGGGQLREFTRVDAVRGELSHQWPRILADGKTVLFTIWYGSVDQAELAAASLDDGKVVRLGSSRHAPSMSSMVSSSMCRPMAWPWPCRSTSHATLRLSDPVRDSITMTGNAAGVPDELGRSRLLHGTTSPAARLGRHRGPVTPAFKEPVVSRLRLSPDGRHAAVGIEQAIRAISGLLDLAAGTLMRLTTTGQTRNPSWSSDGRRIFYPRRTAAGPSSGGSRRTRVVPR